MSKNKGRHAATNFPHKISIEPNHSLISSSSAWDLARVLFEQLSVLTQVEFLTPKTLNTYLPAKCVSLSNLLTVVRLC